MVQPIESIVVVRKDDEMRRPILHPRYEGPIWKSKASAELLSYIETCKYAYHIPYSPAAAEDEEDLHSLLPEEWKAE
ncbi:MAG: hypothetical protein IJR26_11495 [Bacteroidales bacterium]|nr:hypothetical protein [Bacteroidales bacterium]